MSNKLISHQHGGILIPILIAAALFSALAVATMGGTSTSTMMAGNAAVNLMSSQAALIRTRILQCGTDYPTGNNATGFRVNYPAATTSTAVSALACPGNATNLWSQSDGFSLPSVLNGFAAWNYVNDATSMRITIVASTTDRANLLPSIAAKLGSQATVSTNTLTWVLAN